MQLAERVALVTGAGAGIGQAAACLLAREGARVAALERTEPELQETVAWIKRGGGEAMVVIADIARADAMQPALRWICDRWGRFDIIFANAGGQRCLGADRGAGPRGVDQNPRNQPDRDLPDRQVRRAVPEAARRLDHHHLVGQRHPDLQKHWRDGLLLLEGHTSRLHQDDRTGAGPHRIRANVICPGAITTEIVDNTDRRDLNKARVRSSSPRGRSP